MTFDDRELNELNEATLAAILHLQWRIPCPLMRLAKHSTVYPIVSFQLETANVSTASDSRDCGVDRRILTYSTDLLERCNAPGVLNPYRHSRCMLQLARKTRLASQFVCVCKSGSLLACNMEQADDVICPSASSRVSVTETASCIW